jgi:hypothetical protein
VRLIEEHGTQRANQCPQNHGTAIEKPAQRDHEQERKQQDEQELAEAKKAVLPGLPKIKDTQHGNKGVGQRNCPSKRFVGEDI